MNPTLRSLTAAAAVFASCAALLPNAFAQDSAPAGTQTPAVDQRQAKQEQRIDQGISAGSLTKREAHRLEREQGAIKHVESHAKADGTVTRQERRRLHKMQDGASRDIRRQKHDAQHPSNAGGN